MARGLGVPLLLHPGGPGHGSRDSTAIALCLGDYVLAWTGVGASGWAMAMPPLLTALALVLASWHAWRERRRKLRYEWNLVRSNLALRQSALAMEQLARIDALTGLDNRRAWTEKLEAECRRAARYGPARRDHAGRRPVQDRQRSL